HGAGVGADIVAADVLGGIPELWSGLDVDAVDAVEIAAVVDVHLAHVPLQRIVDLTERNAEALGLVAVHVDDELRIVRGVAAEQPGQLGAAASGADHFLDGLEQLLRGVIAAILHLELEAAEVADALNRRGLEGDDQGTGDGEHLGTDAVHHGGGGVLLALALRIGEGLERNEDHALIGGAAGEAEAGDGEHALNLRLPAENRFGLSRHALGVVERS